MKTIKLLILENNEMSFKRISTICADINKAINEEEAFNIECYPHINNLKQFSSLRKVISNLLQSTEENYKQIEVNKIDRIILREKIDVLILDLQLIDGLEYDETTCFQIIKRLENMKNGFIYSVHYDADSDVYNNRLKGTILKNGSLASDYIKLGLNKKKHPDKDHKNDFKNAILKCYKDNEDTSTWQDDIQI